MAVSVPTSSPLLIGPPLPGAWPEAEPTIVWLRGEHDISTDAALFRALALAIALNDAALVLDLREVELVSASTLGVIVTARKFLAERSRSLTVRSPSTFVRRIIGICGLDDLISTSPGVELAAEALGPWLPAAERAGRRHGTPEGVPAHIGQGAALRARAVKIQRMAEIA